MNTQADEDQKVIEAMLFVVAPTNEDLEGYEAAISVCNCALLKAKALWDKNNYDLLASDLLAYANKVEAVMKAPEAQMVGGFPQKSDSLFQGLKKLAPHITECAESLDTEVEF